MFPWKSHTARECIHAGLFRTLLPGVAVMLALALPSCSRDLQGPDSDDLGTAVTIRLTVRSTGTSSSYVAGSGYENFIDISDGDYRVLFFTNGGGNDTFITSFKGVSVSSVNASGYTEYDLTGRVPDQLQAYSDFKVMILANWGSYPEDLTAGVTTIDDVCLPDGELGLFSRKTDFNLGPYNLIPFYGIQEYSGVTFVEDETTVLKTPVSLLRAMAKVEVTLLNTDISLASVRMCRYNDTGCCAPAGVYDGSYVTAGGWTLDNVGIHLPGGGNDEDQTDADEQDNIRRFSFLNVIPSEEAGGGVYETWLAYVPEFGNGGDCCFIEILLTDQATIVGDTKPFRLFFAEYDDDGMLPDDPEYFDIGRNTYYSFTVTFDPTFRVIPQRWEYAFDNDFDIQD